jgi:exonuclease SbcC
MLHSLKIRNGFRHPNTTLDFDRGLTAITGANEKGKTMIFEMIAFSLFGVAALRGSAGDYKKLETELEVTIGTSRYLVTRLAGKASLYKFDDVNGGGKPSIVTMGVKETNARLVDILGYDYNVFKVANYAMQGQTCVLSDMKPAERKRLVDSTIGMDIIDALSKAVAAKMSHNRGVLDGLGPIGEQPVAPVTPEGWEATPKAMLLRTIPVLKEQMVQKARLEEWLSKPLLEPEVLVEEVFTEGILELAERVSAAGRELLTLQYLVTNAKEPSDSKETILALRCVGEQARRYEIWVQFNKVKNELVSLQKNSFSPEELKEYERLLIAKVTYDREMTVWQNSQTSTCPACAHEWRPNAIEPTMVEASPEWLTWETLDVAQKTSKRITELKTQMDSFTSDIVEVEYVSAPTMTESEALVQASLLEQAHTKWDEYLAVKPRYEELMALTANAQAIHEEAARFKAFQVKKQDNLRRQGEYAEWRLLFLTNTEKLSSLGDPSATLTLLENRLHTFIAYESEYKNYEGALAAWEAKRTKVAEVSHTLEQYELVQRSLKELRSEIKKYLVPSLNRVASHLISQMTGGERRTVEVSEDFDIMVDGQPIQTLSGSGKAVANLAIRIGLGQVLINKKFSVFMGDEIDGDMDALRAAHTTECLQRLTANVGQILLISHKRPEVTNYIEL